MLGNNLNCKRCETKVKLGMGGGGGGSDLLKKGKKCGNRHWRERLRGTRGGKIRRFYSNVEKWGEKWAGREHRTAKNQTLGWVLWGCFGLVGKRDHYAGKETSRDFPKGQILVGEGRGTREEALLVRKELGLA